MRVDPLETGWNQGSPQDKQHCLTDAPTMEQPLLTRGREPLEQSQMDKEGRDRLRQEKKFDQQVRKIEGRKEELC